MQEDIREKRTKGYGMMRSLIDYIMGALYLSAAAFLFFAEKFGVSMETFDRTFRFIFGGLCAVYGGWRLYRGYRKDYFY